MTTRLSIKAAADRSGFTPTTLRYYEDIGLVRPAERTTAGYRVYDDRTMERLTFIARAKQLGCSLDEIADLVTAWDGGICGPVQDRLQQLVAAKLETARRQIAELQSLVGDLEQAAGELSGHRPAGACDAACGCIGEPSVAAPAASEPRPVTFGRKPLTSGVL